MTTMGLSSNPFCIYRPVSEKNKCSCGKQKAGVQPGGQTHASTKKSQGLIEFLSFDSFKQTPTTSTVACEAWHPSLERFQEETVSWNPVHAFWPRVLAKLSEPCH